MDIQNNSESNMVEWNQLPWKKFQRVVFRLQKRIFLASQRGDVLSVKKLQKLLLKSKAAKYLAVKKVTQDNRGKKTAGIDGVKSLTPKERISLVDKLRLGTKAKAVRRVWIPKPGKSEKRPLGIPTMSDRALQALVKTVLEPEWEAKFEPNSYGFRPGRSCNDAVEAIFLGIKNQDKYVLDADISGCFDNINHQYLLEKMNTTGEIRRQIKAWLKAGILDKNSFSKPTMGTPQGGIISPLLANIALHGLEKALKAWARTWKGDKWKNERSLSIIRYADDFVVLHKSKEVIHEAKRLMETLLAPIGLELKDSKTRITHTFEGFNFLGFNVRQYKVKGHHNSGKKGNGERIGFKTLIKPSKESCQKHYHALKAVFDSHKSATVKALIEKLNPIIRGWSNYYKAGVSKEAYTCLDHLTFNRTWRWCKRRHPNKSSKWIKEKYFKNVTFQKNGRTYCRNWQLNEEGYKLIRHSDTEIARHVKILGLRSPFDGDWKYWGKRGQLMSENPNRLVKLLKKQKGKCAHCGHIFLSSDVIEIDHITPKTSGGKDDYKNLQALHGHCHDIKTRYDGSASTYVKGQLGEEPDEAKVSRPVLKTSGFRERIA